jgi:hypothetical protein
MGNPVRPIVANLCQPPKKWFRFVDDVFSIIKKRAITNFHNLLNPLTHT